MFDPATILQPLQTWTYLSHPVPCLLLTSLSLAAETSVDYISQNPLLVGFWGWPVKGPGKREEGDSQREVSLSLPSSQPQAASLVAAMSLL